MKAKPSLPKRKPQKKLRRKAPKKRVSKKKKAVKRKTSKKRSEVSMIRYWVLLSEWCNQILWAKYILFIEIKGFWKILSSQKISSMGEIRKYWFSRLIIDESPKKRSQFQIYGSTRNIDISFRFVAIVS